MHGNDLPCSELIPQNNANFCLIFKYPRTLNILDTYIQSPFTFTFKLKIWWVEISATLGGVKATS